MRKSNSPTIVTCLGNDLKQYLAHARSIRVAVALMNDFGLNELLRIPDECRVQFLVGVDLPTPPSVLLDLLVRSEKHPSKFTAKVHFNGATFHPKVYLIEVDDGSFIAFVGSANATKGGLHSNVELTIAISDPTECENLAIWFKNLFESSQILEKPFIADYELTYRRNKLLQSTQKSNLDRFLRRPTEAAENPIVKEGQFFSQDDFDAFGPDNHRKDTAEAKQSRINVQRRLLELHHRIYPHFVSFAMDNLSAHSRSGNITSLPNHNGRTKNGAKEAIWLHYGKTPAELKEYPEGEQTLSSHLRIQVILVNRRKEAYIGVWLYVGKSNSSIQDRVALSSRLVSDEFLSDLFERLVALGGSYWIWFVHKEKIDDYIYVSDIVTPLQLRAFLEKDKKTYNFSTELIIGRNYNPNDEGLGEESIKETVLTDFSRLHKIYSLLKHYSN